jgi:nitrate reductase gamma subunit
MDAIQISQLMAALALVFCMVAFTYRILAFRRRPTPLDRARPNGSIARGLAYAFTLGMAPWSKESTRRHWLAYTRGVVFHVGIFLGLGVLLFSPWSHFLPAPVRAILGTGLLAGAVLGLVGFTARLTEPNLKSLSNPDDYLAVLLVSLFLAAGGLWLFAPQTQIVFYLTSAMLLVYIPLGKIRHCIYFGFSRFYYGLFIGRRAVLPHGQHERGKP